MLAVFDDATAWFGGMNIALEYMGPSPRPSRWVDLSFVMRGKAVAQLQAVFECDWAFAGGSPAGVISPEVLAASPAASVQENPVAPRHLMQAVASGPDAAGDPLYEVLLEGCFEARTPARRPAPSSVSPSGACG